MSAKAEATLAKITHTALALLHHSPLHMSRLVQRLCTKKNARVKANTAARDQRIARVIVQQVLQHCMTRVVSAANQASCPADLELLELVHAMRQTAAAIDMAG